MPIRVYILLAISFVANIGCDSDKPSFTTTKPSTEVLLPTSDGRLQAMPKGQVKVFLFVRVDCPISNRYAPEIRKLCERFSDGVAWRLVYPDPTLSAEDIQKHLADYEYPCEAIHDPEHRLVKLTGATITPEVAVYGPANNLVYCGRIDDRHVDFGRSRSAATQHDLELAIAAALTGKTMDPLRQKAVGCYIDDLNLTE